MDGHTNLQDVIYEQVKPSLNLPIQRSLTKSPLCDSFKENGNSNNKLETTQPTSRNLTHAARLPNGFHASTDCKELRPQHAEEDDDKQSNASVVECTIIQCTAHLLSGSNASLLTKSGQKSNGEEKATWCYRPIVHSVISNNKQDGGFDALDCEIGSSRDSTMEDGDKESSKQLLDLMEFLRAPTDHVNALVNKAIAFSTVSHESSVNVDMSQECQDLTCKNNYCNKKLSGQELDEENLPEKSPTAKMGMNSNESKTEPICCSDLKLSMGKNMPELNEPRNKFKSNSSETSLISTHQTASSYIAQTVECNDRINHYELLNSTSSECTPLPSLPYSLTSRNSLPPSHRPLKKRIGLENILLRRLLQAAKPVNHLSATASKKDLKTDSQNEQMENTTSLHLNPSVQILTDHPKSITVLENDSSSSRTIRNVVEQDSKASAGEEQLSCDDSENSSKRTHKRKCSSPHRIVKKAMTKSEAAIDALSCQDDITPPLQILPISKISNTIQKLPAQLTATNAASIVHLPHSKTSPLSNPVPFLSMNVITIAPDEGYSGPPLTVKSKSSSLKSLRPLAPKISVSPTLTPKNTSSNVLAGRHAAAPTSIIPISLVQSTTNPSLVILVNKGEAKGTRFISTQPFHIHPQQKQSNTSWHLQQQDSNTGQMISSSSAAIPITSILAQNNSPIRLSQPKQFSKTQSSPKFCTRIPQSQPQSLSSTSNGNSRTMPKLRYTGDYFKSKVTQSILSPTVSSPTDAESPETILENFFEPIRNNCILGKFVAPELESSKILVDEAGSVNSRHVCGSCGCTYASETALKEHVERKSFLVTFECSCQSAGVTQPPSFFYNLCSFSTYYRNHVLQHPYVPHSPANSYKISPLPDDQLPEECLRLLKEKEKSFMPFNGKPASEKPEEVFSPISLIADIADLSHSTKEKSRPMIQCKECSKEFRLPLRIKQHFQSWSKGAIKSINSEKNVGQELPHLAAQHHSFHKCFECSIILPNACSFKAHCRLHESKEPFVCPECGLTFSTFEVMKEHAYKVCYHGCRRTIIKGCRFCHFIPQDSSGFSESLDVHISKAHKSSLLRCPKCTEIFKDATSLHKHSLLLHGTALLDNDFQLVSRCPVCEDIVSSSFELHLSGHEVESKSKSYFFSCSECSKNFVYRAELEKHLRSSGHLCMKANGFVCKLCILTYPTREERCNHILTEHPNFKDMFLNELNKSELLDLPLIGRRELVSPSNLCPLGRREMPSLQLINPVIADASNSTFCGNTASLPPESTKEIPLAPLCSGGVKRQNSDGCISLKDVTYLSDVANETLEAPPQRWECSRCNEIFLNRDAFHRHQQKHRFLEQSKSKKKKLIDKNENTKIRMSLTTSEVISSATNVTDNVIPLESVENCNASPPADVTKGSQLEDTRTDEFVGKGIKDEAENGYDSADCSSTSPLEPDVPNSQNATKNYKILPQMLQKSQMQEQLDSGMSHSQPLQSGSLKDDCDVKVKKWYSCQLCCLSYSSSEKLQHHVDARHIGLQLVKPETYICSYCAEPNKKVFASIRHLLKHLRVRHKIVRNKAGQYTSLEATCKPESSQQFGITCTEVKEGELSSDGKCGSEPFSTSPKSEGFGNVLRDNALVEDEDESLRDPGGVRSRKIFGSSESIYTCSYCDHINLDQSNFWEHIICHEKELLGKSMMDSNKSFQCPECGSMFVVRVALFRHLKLVHRIPEELSYESELKLFESFRAQKQSFANSSSPPLSSFQNDLPADKLAKLASLRPEDIHSSLANSPKATFFSAESLSDHLPNKRQGLRSQITDPSLPNPGLSSLSSGEGLEQNECQVCYKIFDSQVELKIHMRVHGMAFIQGTRRSMINGCPTTEEASPSTSSCPTNQKTLTV